MHWFGVARALILITIANGAPVIARYIFGDLGSQPIDFGRLWYDRRPLFGPSKTLRGVVYSLGATVLAAVLLHLGWLTGIAIAAAAMAGDLLSSLLKRRFGLPPSARAIGLDQIPECVLPCIVSAHALGLSAVDVLVVTSAFFAGQILLSQILYRLHIRRRPH